jgi:hypothetical protein
MSESIAGEPWDPDRIGMNVRNMWQSWDKGGPSVQHSEWWLREHWGRAFDVELLDDPPADGHGLIVLSKRPVELTRDDLVLPAQDPRELAALAHNVETLIVETIALDADRDAAVRAAYRRMESSKSWRLTTPLRKGAARLRRWGLDL